MYLIIQAINKIVILNKNLNKRLNHFKKQESKKFNKKLLKIKIYPY